MNTPENTPDKPTNTKDLEVTPTSVAIVVPVYDKIYPCYYESMMGVASSKTKHQIYRHSEYGVASIPKSRNHLAAWFLTETPCEWMLMTDVDMEFNIKDIDRLLSRKKPLIGGLYKQRVEQDKPIYVLNPMDKEFDIKDGVVQQVRYVGTGFMLIHRSTLIQLIQQYPEIEYYRDYNEGGKKCWDFFGEGLLKGRRLSCDWAFCEKWNKLGGQVFVDTETLLPHWGMNRFV